MRTFAALIWREIAERRLLLLASAVLGLVPIILPFVPGGPDRYAPEDIRTAVTVVLTWLFGIAALLMIGSSIVARDLIDKRLGFYFSRPISPWALWAARMIAACVLVVASLLLIMGPSAAVDSGAWLDRLSRLDDGQTWPILTPLEHWQQRAPSSFLGEYNRHDFPSTPANPTLPMQLVLGLGTLLLLLALVHAVSSIVRGRNVWLLADLAGLALFVGLVWTAREGLLAERALGALVWAEWLFVPAALGALLLAGGVQLAGGRTDLLRSHRCLSLTLWPALVVVALAFLGYSRWVEASSFEDVEVLGYVDPSPDEEWLAVGGKVRGRGGAEATFLFHPGSQRSWRLGNPGFVRAWLTFSADGSTAAWPRCETVTPIDCEIWALDLRDPSRSPRRTKVAIVEPGRWKTPIHLRLALSADGTRLAVAEAARFSVHELASGRLVVAVTAKRPHSVVFLSRDEVRFHERIELESGRFDRIRELDLRTRDLVETGWLQPGLAAVRSLAADTVFYRRRSALGIGLYEGESGRPLFELDGFWMPKFDYGRFLADGRFVLVYQERDVMYFTVYSPSGEEEHRIERPGVLGRHMGGELEPGRLLIALQEDPWTTPLPAAPVDPLLGWSTYVLDADAGELTRLAEGVVPLGVPSPAVPQRLFLGGRQTVVRWDPEAGEPQIVLAPRDVHPGVDFMLLDSLRPGI